MAPSSPTMRPCQGWLPVSALAAYCLAAAVWDFNPVEIFPMLAILALLAIPALVLVAWLLSILARALRLLFGRDGV